MASRNLSPVRTLVRELIPIVGSFAFNGAGAIDATTRQGLGFTASRIGVGQYRVSLKNPDGSKMTFASIVSVQGQAQLAATADTQVNVGPIDMTNMTVDFFVLTAGVAADIAANANNRLNFQILARNSSATPVRG